MTLKFNHPNHCEVEFVYQTSLGFLSGTELGLIYTGTGSGKVGMLTLCGIADFLGSWSRACGLGVGSSALNITGIAFGSGGIGRLTWAEALA